MSVFFSFPFQRNLMTWNVEPVRFPNTKFGLDQWAAYDQSWHALSSTSLNE